MRVFTLFLASLFVLIACNKEKVPTPMVDCKTVFPDPNPGDTIYPSDFAPYYPGSWWKYSGDINSTTYDKTDQVENWVDITFSEAIPAQPCVEVHKYNKVVPYFGGYVAGMSKYHPENSDYISGKLIPFMDTVVGVFYNQVSNEGTFELTATIECVERLPMMVVNGMDFSDVIHIKYVTKQYFYHNHYSSVYTTHRYFAKNVGCIQEEALYGNSQFAPLWQITDYYIAPLRILKTPDKNR